VSNHNIYISHQQLTISPPVPQFLKEQGIIEGDLKAITTRNDSDLSEGFWRVFGGAVAQGTNLIFFTIYIYYTM
jgi:hypothetical protein